MQRSFKDLGTFLVHFWTCEEQNVSQTGASGADWLHFSCLEKADRFRTSLLQPAGASLRCKLPGTLLPSLQVCKANRQTFQGAHNRVRLLIRSREEVNIPYRDYIGIIFP